MKRELPPEIPEAAPFFRCVFWVAQLKILPSSQSRKLEEAEGPRIFMSREIRQAIREILLCIRSGSLGRKTAP